MFWQKGIIFLAGVIVAPILKPILRPVAREVVKCGLVVGHYVHKLAVEAREDIDDLAAEAEKEIDEKARKEKKERHTPQTH